MAPRSVAKKRSLDESETSSLSEGADGKKFAKKQWQEEEDAVLLRVVTQYQERNGVGKGIEWTVIASQVAKAGVAGRDNKSCRLRWKDKLSGDRLDIELNPFTAQEDTFILEAHAMWGKRGGPGNVGRMRTDWAVIARCLPGRSGNDIKNRWNSHLAKRAGQVPHGPSKGGMIVEEVEREFGIIKNMLELIKANAAEYKVVYVPASGQAPLPPTQPPIHAQLALPTLAAATAPMPASTAAMAASTAPMTQPESFFEVASLLDFPDHIPAAAHGQAPPPPTEPPAQLAAPTLAAAAAPKTPTQPESVFDPDSLLTFPEDAELLDPPLDEGLQDFMAGVGLLASGDKATAAPPPPPPIGVDELGLLMDAFKKRADPFVAQRNNFDFVPLAEWVL